MILALVCKMEGASLAGWVGWITGVVIDRYRGCSG